MSPEACSGVCTAAVGPRPMYTSCYLSRSPKYAPGYEKPGPQAEWFVRCTFTPSERQCESPAHIPTN